MILLTVHGKTLLGNAVRVRAVSVDEVEIRVQERVALLIRFLVALVDPRRHRGGIAVRGWVRLGRVLRGTQKGQEERFNIRFRCKEVHSVRGSRQ